MRGFIVEAVRKLVRTLSNAPVVGHLLSGLAKEREHASVMVIENRLRKAGFDTLLYGPFRGMKYPTMNHLGYASLPMKFLGTYERELHAVVSNSLRRNYSLVLNIGAADGYYACGYAYKLPNAKVIAWEMISFVAALTENLALANGLVSRVEIRGLCTPSELQTISNSGHCLVFSDCEGAEITLLTLDNLSGLASFDLIIECHDHLVDGATATLVSRFSKTHDVTILDSKPLELDDVPKAGMEAAGGPSIELYRALEENRLFAMKWIVAYDKRKT